MTKICIEHSSCWIVSETGEFAEQGKESDLSDSIFVQNFREADRFRVWLRS